MYFKVNYRILHLKYSSLIICLICNSISLMCCKAEIKKTHCNFWYHFALWLIPVCSANLLMAFHTLPGVLVTPKLSVKAHVHSFLFILKCFLSYWSGLAGQKTRDTCCCPKLCPVSNGNQVIRNFHMLQSLVSPSFRWGVQLRRWHVLLGMIIFPFMSQYEKKSIPIS